MKKLMVAIVLFLTACTEPMTTGYVTQKKYEPSYTWYSHQCMSYSSSGWCKFSIPIPNTEPEKYKLELEDANRKGWIEVDKDTYGKYTVFQHYPNPM